ncbi:unnamed protein product [Soboliphyme baturini]|uniref:NUC domain-containing protein n=1 Tax=Soboliphyme baturini TaxID=241478 RepID=A0A183IYN7_9BILA|nr:unnamed protein product [Soboliphyme baturini]
MLRCIFISGLNRKKRSDPPPECKGTLKDWKEAIACDYKCPKGWSKNPLLIMSFDGLQRYYLDRHKTAAINLIKEHGSHSPFMYPSFPSKTIPNHYAIVTGLYPESHGIVENKFYDPQMQKKFSMAGDIYKDPAWWKGEPIWNTAQNNNMKSATHIWAGSEVQIQGKYPSYFAEYNPNTSFTDKIDQIIQWLKLEEVARPSVINSYFNQPDLVGHDHGPNSKDINDILKMVDNVPDYLMTSLFKNGLFNCLNIIILADHGMQTVHKEFLNLQQYVDTKGMVIFAGGPLARITLNASSFTAQEVLKKLTCETGMFRAYDRFSMPKRLHYFRNPRIGDIIVMATVGTTIWEKTKNEDETGSHGYDYRFPTMHATFIAYGPAFKRNFLMEQPFPNIELYNLFTYLIGAKVIAPHNGTVGALNPILITPQTIPKFTPAATVACPAAKDKLDVCESCSAKKTISHEAIRPDDLAEACLVADVKNCATASKQSQALKGKKLTFHSLLSLRKNYWSNLTVMLKMYATLYEDLHVISGPIFDYDADGLADESVSAQNIVEGVPIPSHYYLIMVKCNGVWTRDSCDGQPKVQSFVLPNVENVVGCYVGHFKPHLNGFECKSPSEFFFINTARVRDIEQLTKMRFFPNWDANEAALLRTHIIQSLWPISF